MSREIHRGDGIHVKHIAPNHWWQRAKWELLQDYTSTNGMVTAPKGFVTDGASIFFLLRWRFSPTGRYFGAAIVHDYIIIEYNDWDMANKQFDEELDALNIGKFEHNVLLGAVRVWGWFKKTFNLKPKKLQ